ncbi:Spy/CpxP family protein refolding chaperone [Chitinivorax tropicus]|uniref:Spy/CpxP family protein refolding chaperone n=1 Tax=Chitinivorax tropicus TaxID=714531 RepID=A0A840MF70_9PROT|nr:Spy/CpxP family protein refolding chaperone [Chitinivorax tropicus]MBB5017328.1 Spy/CpxP family protein refolding chaperone [Chitinivorax tropicus]
MSSMLKRSLLITSLITAMTGSAFASPGGPHQGAPRDGGPHAGMVWHMLGKAKDKLNLSAEQQALWQTAEKASGELREQMKAQHQKMRALMDAQSKETIIDLAKLDAAGETMRNNMDTAHDGVRKAWLNVYASLTAAQKEQVSNLLKQVWANKGKHRSQDDHHPNS